MAPRNVFMHCVSLNAISLFSLPLPSITTIKMMMMTTRRRRKVTLQQYLFVHNHVPVIVAD